MAFSGYMTVSLGHIHEPFRILGGFIILLAIMLIINKSTRFTQHIFLATFTVSLSLAYSLKTISIFFVAILAGMFNIELGFLFHTTLLIIKIIVYFCAYKSLKLENGIPEFEEKGIKSGVWAIAAMTLILYSGIITFANIVDDKNHLMFWPTFGFLLIAFVSLIVGITAFAKHLIDIRLKKNELEQEKQKNQKVVAKLEKLEANLHKEKSKKSVVSMAYKGLLNEVPSLIGKNDSAQIKKINNYIQTINEFAPELTKEPSIDTKDIHIRTLKIPDRWTDLKLLLVNKMTLAEEKGISMLVNNEVENWDLIPISKKDFACLIGNLLDNAIKETAKKVSGHKEVNLQLYDENNQFTIDVTDSAHEFKLDILKNLGVRGNSTNGTGHGYVEILEIIHQTGASLLIREWDLLFSSGKSIGIVFDGMGEISIESHYRREMLINELEDSVLEVV